MQVRHNSHRSGHSLHDSDIYINGILMGFLDTEVIVGNVEFSTNSVELVTDSIVK